MIGVCVDACHPMGAPPPRRLRALMPRGATAVRQVLLHDPRVLSYLTTIGRAGIGIVVVVAGESFATTNYKLELQAYANLLSGVSVPDLWIIGNEPNAPIGAPSSWAMTTDEYTSLWNSGVAGIRNVFPNAKCAIGGLLGKPAAWIDTVLSQLDPTPDVLDIHYPEDESVFDAYRDAYAIPLSVGEWNYVGKRVSPQQFSDYALMLERRADPIMWFSYHDIGGDAGYMGLLSPSGYKRKAWDDFHSLF